MSLISVRNIVADTKRLDHENTESCTENMEPLVWKSLCPRLVKIGELAEALHPKHGRVRGTLSEVFTARQSEAKLEQDLDGKQDLH